VKLLKIAVIVIAGALHVFGGDAEPAWKKKVSIDSSRIKEGLAEAGVSPKSVVSYFTGRWPFISFIGGMAMGNRSEELEFFYSEPFKWRSQILDYVLENGGKVYGLRIRMKRYKEGPVPKPLRSFLFHLRTDVLLNEYYPSYILVNGRRVWDFKKDKLQAGGIDVPFSVAEPADLIIDLVIDKDYTPDTKGLAFRMFDVKYLGEPGEKVDLATAEAKASSSPADKLQTFPFGLYPSGYDFWTNKGRTFAEIEKAWKPNFTPEYPTDEIAMAPFCWHSHATGKFHDFMIRFGGCNLAGEGAAADVFKNNPYLRGVVVNNNNTDDWKRVLKIDPKLQVHWFRGENGTGAGEKAIVEAAKKAAGNPERITALYEPFPPTLNSYLEYDRGSDIVVLKNQEDPNANILVSMSRGAGRACGKPFGFYWEQTHYPFPSLDQKLHACMLYHLSGASFIGAEMEEAPSFESGVVAEWVFPYVQALRFAMVHPARGKPIVPVGIVYSAGDAWWIPFNQLAVMDPLQRYLEYDHATKTLRGEPLFTKVFPWMPQENTKAASWKKVGHLALFIDRLDELQGYNLLDVFFPGYGDAYTARITRLLTGTPYGPLDFVPLEKASAAHLQSFGVLACLGHGRIQGETEAKLAAAAASGAQLIVGAQDFTSTQAAPKRTPFGLAFGKEACSRIEGPIEGVAEIFNGGAKGNFSGEIFSATGEGWETVASVEGKPLVLKKKNGKGAIYMYLGRWMHQGGAALRAILAYAGEQAAPLKFDRAEDRLEYVAYQKNQGAWVALFNHGGIVVGCDRLDTKTWRVSPPEPLFSEVKGPFNGSIEFRLEKLGLDPAVTYALYEVRGIDDPEFEAVISGQKSFDLREVASETVGGSIKAALKFNKRAEYVIAPKGKEKEVFFGKP